MANYTRALQDELGATNPEHIYYHFFDLKCRYLPISRATIDENL